ncbi:MAG: hypothetical protein M1832_003322 [Thelocarpon impressellum]|nr:MAG: hypothetical protein M1832_003322 [Thelocarpon impressellum]
MFPAEELLAKINKDALLAAASTLAGDAQCHFAPFSAPQGQGYVLLIIEFPSLATRWVARFPLDQYDSFREFCVVPLEYVARRYPRVPAPRIHGYVDAGSDVQNPVGAAYVLLDWVEGASVPPWDAHSPSAAVKEKILHQIADLMLDLILGGPPDEEIIFYGVPEGTPKGIPVSTTAWLTESVDRGLRRALRQQNSALAVDYLMQRAMIPRYVVAEHDTSPWAVMHGDLHGGNIIVNEDSSIRGVIDWDFTSATPLQVAATFPKLLENVPGGAPPEIPESLAYVDLSADKASFLRILAAKEKARANGNTAITTLVESSSERKFFEMSLHRRAVHREFVERFCARTRENVLAASAQVEPFLVANLRFFGGSDAAMVEVAAELEKLKAETEKGSTAG